MSVEYSILTVLAIHFIADFVFQSREMGRRKGKSIKLLSLHVFVYTIVTLLGWKFILGINYITMPSYTLILFFLITFLTHWVTDFITSKMSGYCYLKMIEEKKLQDEMCENAMPGSDEIYYNGEGDRTKERRWEYGFWTAIGFDQLIHAFTLIATYNYFF